MKAAYNAQVVAKSTVVVNGQWYFVSTITRDAGEGDSAKVTETLAWEGLATQRGRQIVTRLHMQDQDAMAVHLDIAKQVATAKMA